MNIIQPEKKKDILPFETTWMNLKDIMLSGISQHRKENTVLSQLYVELYWRPTHKTEQNLNCLELATGETGDVAQMVPKFGYAGWMNSGNLSTVWWNNYRVYYTWDLLRECIRSVHTRKKMQVSEMTDMLISLNVVIIPQHTCLFTFLNLYKYWICRNGKQGARWHGLWSAGFNEKLTPSRN